MADLGSLLDWLYSTQLFGIKLGLEQTKELLEQSNAMPREGVRVVHVAGTNGKGSTCAMIEVLARANGIKTGLFTSPHLVNFSERIRVDGCQINEGDLLRLLCEMRQLAESREQAPTFFELTLVLAMRYFAEQNVEMIILETGLGGRLDATNAVPKDIAVLTPIALDHQQYLGNALAEVASEKAGIIATGKPVVSAIQEPDAMAVIKQVALERDAELIVIDNEGEIPNLPLAGDHQRRNALLAIAAIKKLECLPGRDLVEKAFRQLKWPGRFERVENPLMILDGAHNPHAMGVLVETWQHEYGDAKTPVVFAASADKNIQGIIRLLNGIASEWRLVPCSSPRILPAREMEVNIRESSRNPVIVYDSLADAVAQGSGNGLPVLVTGSLFLIGDAKAMLSHDKARETLQ